MELIVTDINNNIGPGDIVGAFINEASIDSKDIGNIDIHNNKAEVEVADDVARQVIDAMDNNKVGGVEINIYPKNREDLIEGEVYTYIRKYKKLVELERIEEMERHELEIKRLSPREREEKGRAILHLKGRDAGKAFGNKPMIKFIRQKPGEELPDTEISVGDLVMLSKKRPLDDDNPEGTVAEKTKYSLTVVFDNKPPSFVYGKGLRLDLYVNDITFQRMLTALDKVKKLDKFRGVLLGQKEAEWAEEKIGDIDWVNQSLNFSQKKAVKNSFNARDFYLIQGPPGTGKTMTAIEIINQVEQTAREGAYGSGFTEELGYGILDVEALLGEIEPMEYGAIEVKSDVVYGLIAIFDADGNMVSFGATGDNYNRIFPAIKPGTYTVTLSFMGTVVEDVVNVTADERTAVELMIND